MYCVFTEVGFAINKKQMSNSWFLLSKQVLVITAKIIDMI